jgi:spore coat polysaccharide biosynthesis protein SpsF
MNGKNIVAIIQARMTSSRLRGKAMLDLCGKTVLERVLLRTQCSHVLNDIWLATSFESQDDVLALVGRINSAKVFRGDLYDVLARFCGVIHKSQSDIIVRITADNPFTEARFIDLGVEMLIREKLDYIAFKNIPVGVGVEVVTKEALIYSGQHARDKEDREHVTTFIKKNPEIFKVRFADSPIDELKRPDVSVTIDTLDDYLKLYKALYFAQKKGKPDVSLEDMIFYLDQMK